MENRNLQSSKRAKAPLILIFSVNTNHESVAYRSFSPSKFEARGARKVTTGIRFYKSTSIIFVEKFGRRGVPRGFNRTFQRKGCCVAGVPGNIYFRSSHLILDMVDRVAVQLLHLVLGISLIIDVFDNPALPPI